jgi:hypothetical protein
MSRVTRSKTLAAKALLGKEPTTEVHVTPTPMTEVARMMNADVNSSQCIALRRTTCKSLGQLTSGNTPTGTKEFLHDQAGIQECSPSHVSKGSHTAQTSSAKEGVEDAEKSSSNAAFGVPKNEQNQVFNTMPQKPVSLIASPDRDENEGIHDSKPEVADKPAEADEAEAYEANDAEANEADAEANEANEAIVADEIEDAKAAVEAKKAGEVETDRVDEADLADEATDATEVNWANEADMVAVSKANEAVDAEEAEADEADAIEAKASVADEDEAKVANANEIVEAAEADNSDEAIESDESDEADEVYKANEADEVDEADEADGVDEAGVSIEMPFKQIVQMKMVRAPNAIYYPFDYVGDTDEESMLAVGRPVKMENCESPDRSAEPAYWGERSRKKDAERKATALQAAKEAENNDPFQEETRIELVQIQLFTSTEREKAAGFKQIVKLGSGFFNIFKSSKSPIIFVDFVSAEGDLIVRAEVPSEEDAHKQLFGNGGFEPCLGWNLFNMACERVHFRRHYFWFRNNHELAIALFAMFPNDFELAAHEFFDKKGRFFAEKYTMPSHRMLRAEDPMDIDVDHIEVAKQPLSTPEALDRYGNDPYECSQSLY